MDEIFIPISLLLSDFIKYLRTIGRYEHLAQQLENHPRHDLINLLKRMDDISNQLLFNEVDEGNRETYVAIKQLEILYSKITRHIQECIQLDTLKQDFSYLHQRFIKACQFQKFIQQLNPELCSEPYAIQLQDYKNQLLTLMHEQLKSDNYPKKVLFIIASIASIVTATLIIHFQLGMIALAVSLILLTSSLLYKKSLLIILIFLPVRMNRFTINFIIPNHLGCDMASKRYLCSLMPSSYRDCLGQKSFTHEY